MVVIQSCWLAVQLPDSLQYPQDALRWALQIAEALAYLHQFSPLIVHRDLKLENILLTSPVPRRADAKLADFGLHKMIKASFDCMWTQGPPQLPMPCGTFTAQTSCPQARWTILVRICIDWCLLQDVASGVPMAQSTEQLQVLLKDMGFEQTTPREASQAQLAQQHLRQSHHQRQSEEQHSSGDERQSCDSMAAPPLVPAAAAQRRPAAGADGGRADCDSAHSATHSPRAVAEQAAAGQQHAWQQQPGPSPADFPQQQALQLAAETTQVLPAGSRAADDSAADVSAGGGALPPLQGTEAAPLLQGSDTASHDPHDLLASIAEQGQQLPLPAPPPQQHDWRRWSESTARDMAWPVAGQLLPPLPASPFQVPRQATGFIT